MTREINQFEMRKYLTRINKTIARILKVLKHTVNFEVNKILKPVSLTRIVAIVALLRTDEGLQILSNTV